MLSYAAGVNVAMFRDGKTSREIQASTVLSKHIFFLKFKQISGVYLMIQTSQRIFLARRKEIGPEATVTAKKSSIACKT